jgi:TP901 family phage tail tape measure protein
MAGLEVASLFGTLSLRDDATASLRQFDNSLTRIGDGLSNFGGRLTGLGTSLGMVFLPLAAGIGAGISVAADFDATLAEISARTGLTGTALDELRQTALQLGADTAFSAQDAAGAFLQLLSSGQSYEDALETIRPVLDAAAASGMGLAESADAVTDVMSIFRLPAARATVVTNALARAAGASSATMADLAEAFTTGGAQAALMGLSVDETAAIFATFAENGIKGSEAGNQLKSMLQNMTRTTEPVGQAWTELGISMFEANGDIRDLNVVLDEMNVRLDSMSDQQRIDILQALGGSFGIVGLNALLASEGFDQMETAMAGSASASDVASAMMDTFNGRVDSLRGSVETLMIEALTPLMDNVLQPLVEDLTETVNGITEWATANPELTTTIASLVLGGAALSLGLVVVGTLLSAIGTVVTFVGGAIGLLSGGVTLLMSGALLPIIPILFVIGGMFLAYQNNVAGFKDRVDELGVTFRKGYDEAMQLITAMQTLARLDPRFLLSGTGALIGTAIGAQQQGQSGQQPLIGQTLPGGGDIGFGTNDATDRRKSARGGGGDTYTINVQMPVGATVGDGQRFGDAIMAALRQNGGR